MSNYLTLQVSEVYDETLRIELLRLSTLLLKYLPNELELVNNRIKVFNFAWNHLKEDDSVSQQWAFVNACQFLVAHEAPPNMILQVEHIIYKCLFRFSIKLADFISVIEALCFYFSYSKNCKLARVIDKTSR